MKEIFDEEFCSKLKAFYSADVNSYYSVMGNYRRTGRTAKFSKVLLEIAIESGQDINIIGHEVDCVNSRKMDEHMRRAIHERVEEYARMGVIIECRFKHNSGLFSASIYSGREIYERHRIEPFKTNKPNPFPIIELEEEKEYSKNKLLLLLY